MYLYRKVFIWTDDNKGWKIPKKYEKRIDINKIKYVMTEVMYWRKAQDIHNWFVDNVQDGRDDCASYYVDRDNLKELKKWIDKKLKNIDKERVIKKLEGEDDWDYEQLIRTSNFLNEELSEEFNDYYEYHSYRLDAQCHQKCLTIKAIKK